MQSHKDISTEVTSDQTTTGGQPSLEPGGLDQSMSSSQAAALEHDESALESLIALKEEISGLSTAILHAIAGKREPIDELMSLNAILEGRFDEVWDMLHVPAFRLERSNAQGGSESSAANGDIPLDEEERAKLGDQEPNGIFEEKGAQTYQVAQEPIKQEPNRGSLKLNFYHLVLGPIAEAMLEEKCISKPSYAMQMISFFRNIIIRFLARDTLCDDLCRIAGEIFNWERSLHARVLNTYLNASVNKYDKGLSYEARRSQPELAWRMQELKVGDKVDVIKHAAIHQHGTQLVQAWSRGTVVFRGVPEDEEATEVGKPATTQECTSCNEENEAENAECTAGSSPAQHKAQESERRQVLLQTKVDIRYERDREAEVKRFGLFDPSFAPPGRFTDDWEWRLDLKVDDQIDCMDTEKQWLKATVLHTRTAENTEGEAVPEVLVGYRTFDDAGPRPDEERGQNYFGWSNRYDEWVPVTSPLVQRFRSTSLQYQRVEKANKLYERPDSDKFNDTDDVLYETRAIQEFATARDLFFGGFKSIPDALNQFGESGGFQRILDALAATAQGKHPMKIEHLKSLCVFLCRTLPLWTRRFSVRFIPPFTDLLLRAMCYVNKGVTDQNKKDVVLGIFQHDDFGFEVFEQTIDQFVEPLWRRYNTVEMVRGKILVEYRIYVGAAMMGLSNLQKRIGGIKYINDSIKHVRQVYNPARFLSSPQVIQLLRDLKIFEAVFGENTHYQLVHRSQDLVKLFFSEKEEEVTKEEIDLIWNVCNKQGQQIKLEVYKVILDVFKSYSSSNMADETKEYFIDKIKEVPPAQVIEKDIQIVTELGRKIGVSYRQPEAFVVKSAEFLWSVAILEKDYPKAIALKARKKFCDQVASWDDSLKEKYVALCVQNIEKDSYSLQNLKITTKLISKMSFSSYNGKKTKNDYARELIETKDFIWVIIKDLERYTEYSNSLFKRGALTRENVKTFELEDNHFFTHFKNLSSRLKRIKALLHTAKMQLTSEQMEGIWDIMVKKSELREHDQNVFFSWFKDLLEQDAKHVITEELTINLFRVKIVPSDLRLLKSLRVYGLACIVRLFVLVNEIKGNVLDLDPLKHKKASDSYWQQNSYSYSPYQGGGYGNNAYGNNSQEAGTKPKFNRFRVNIMPAELEGIKILWSLLGAHDETNVYLFTMVQRTLINIYSNLSVALESKKLEISDQFVAGCLECLKSISEDSLVSRTGKQKKESNRFICQMIQTFFEASEEAGIGQLKLHRQIDRGELLKNIVVETRLSFKKGSLPSFLVLNLHAHTTVWALKCLIAEHLDLSPQHIQIKRGDKKADIRDNKNCQLLSDLDFKSDEVLAVSRGRIPEVTPVPLTDREGKMVPELEAIVRQWFLMYSTELTREEVIKVAQEEGPEIEGQNPRVEAAIPERIRVMTRETCVEFVKAMTTLPSITRDDYRVKTFFASYSRALGNGNLITEEELLHFYADQSKNKDDAVAQNLKHQDIGLDLKPKIDYQGLSWSNDRRVVKDETILPRARLSSDLATINQLFDLVEDAQSDEAEPIWALLLALQTNREIEKEILGNQSSELLTIQGLDTHERRPKNLYKILYCLRIVLSLICEFKKSAAREITLYVEDANAEAAPSKGQGGKDEERKESPSPECLAKTDVATEVVEGRVVGGEERADGTPHKPEPGQPQRGIEDSDSDDPGKGITTFEVTAEAPAARTAIPLPYDGPLRNGQPQENVPPEQREVQVAPASPAAVAAPNSSNVVTYSTHFLTIADFVGNQVGLPIQDGIAKTPEEEQLRKAWLPQFLQGGGIAKLLALIESLSKFTSVGKQVTPNTLRVAKKCLVEVMQCVKILLSCSFCANSPDEDLALSLQRKLSTHSQPGGEAESTPERTRERADRGGDKAPAEESRALERKNKLQEDQDNILEEMGPLIRLLRERPDLDISSDLTQGLEEFQQQLLDVIFRFIESPESKVEDTEIVKQGLSIWMSCLASEPSLFNTLVEEKREDSFANQLIEKGLVSKEFRVREPFANTVRFIVHSIKSPVLLETPLGFFVRLLISKLGHVQRVGYSRYTKHYFSLIRELLPVHLQRQRLGGEDAVNAGAVIKDVVARLKKHDSFESKDHPWDDHTLVGLLDTISILFVADATILSAEEVKELATVLLENCLFSFNWEPVEADITPEIDLAHIQRKSINKCHAKDSTQAAYRLLVSLCRSQVVAGLTDEVIEKYWVRQIYAVDRPQKAGFAPQADGRHANGYCGIFNVGQVCYMNSMMQQFFNVPTLRYCLLSANDEFQEDMQEHNGCTFDDNFLHQMMTMFGHLILSDRQCYVPTPLCYSFKSYDGERTNVREQKDAQEFLNVAFDRLETLLKDTSQKYLLDNVFGGKTCEIKRCKNCGHTRKSSDVFFNLSLEVKNQSSVHDGLRKLTTPEIIGDWKCDECNTKTDLEKTTAIEECPNTLVVHLQRITFDFEVLRNVKYNDRIEFPNVLDLKPFSATEILKKNSAAEKAQKSRQNEENNVEMKKETSFKSNEANDEDEKEDESEQIKETKANHEETNLDEEGSEGGAGEASGGDFEFKLVGVVIHSGIADAGHYYSYINVERNKEAEKTEKTRGPEWLDIEAQTWLEFNDQSVTRFKFADLESSCFGGPGKNSNAYMLIYEKRVKEKMKIVIPNKVIDALACDGTTMSSSQEDIHIFKVFPQLRESLARDKASLLYDEERKENFVFVDFDDATKFVPNSIYRKVHEDNKRFLSEKQVFNDSFYRCTHELLSLSAGGGENMPGEKFDMLFKVIDRVVFDLLFNSAAHAPLKRIADLLMHLMQDAEAATVYLVQHRMFAPAESLGKDEKNFFEAICTHLEPDVRETAASLFVFALGRLHEIGGDENMALVDRAITALLDLMPQECNKHLGRLEAYFGCILELARRHSDFLVILTKKHTVLRMVDLLSKYNPLYASVNPPFEKLISTICFICRSIPCVIDLNDSTNYDGVDPQSEIDTMEQIVAMKGASRHHIPLTDSYEYYDTDTLPLLELPEDCNKAVFIFQKWSKKFYENASRQGYQPKEYAKLVAHLCFKNYAFSRKIAKHILKGVNSIYHDETATYLQLMKVYLSIEDEYFDQRVEWIFGVADLVIRTTTQQLYGNQRQQEPRLGVAYADNVASQTCRYFSPLYKTASSLHGRQECALQALLSARRTQSKTVLLSLKCILEAVLGDDKKRLLKYLCTMDPPTYQYARYWDWIKPWVESEVVQNKKFAHMQGPFRAELEPSIDVLNLIELVEKKLIDREAIGPKHVQQPGDLIEYPYEKDGGPHPYVLWDIVDAAVHSRQQEQDNTGAVVVQATAILSNISTSYPTGEDNLALVDAFQRNNWYAGNGGKMQNRLVQKANNSSAGSGAKGAHHIRRFGASSKPSLGRQGKSRRGGKKRVYHSKEGEDDEDGDSEDLSDEEEESMAKEDVRALVNDTKLTSSPKNAKAVRFADQEEQIVGQGVNSDIENDAGYQDADLYGADKNEWECSACTAKNREANVACVVCELPRNPQKTPLSEDKAQISTQGIEAEKSRAAAIQQALQPGAEGIEAISNTQQPADDHEDAQELKELIGYDDDCEKGLPQAKNTDQATEENIELFGRSESPLVDPSQSSPDVADGEKDGEHQQQEDQTEETSSLKRKKQCVLSFRAENNTNYSKIIWLEFRATGANPPNFKLPLSRVPCEIFANQNTSVIHFTKIDPAKDWGDFEWCFTIGDKSPIAMQNTNNNYSTSNNNEMYETYPVDYVDGSAGDTSPLAGPQDASAEKNCPQCTFLNPPSAYCCSVCEYTFR